MLMNGNEVAFIRSRVDEQDGEENKNSHHEHLTGTTCYCTHTDNEFELNKKCALAAIVDVLSLIPVG